MKFNLENLINNYVFNNPVKMLFKPKLYNPKFNKFLTNIDLPKIIGHTKQFKYSVVANNKIRIINFPNFFAYVYVANAINNKSGQFHSIKSNKNRMKIHYDQRRFLPDNYRKSTKQDADDLLFKYESMSFFDIRNFYNSIYTHCFEKIKYLESDEEKLFKFIDDSIRLMNSRKTKGLLLGNLLSLVCANELLEYLVFKINEKLTKDGIKHDISYFSDQIYVKHRFEDKDKVEKTIIEVISQDYFEFLLADEKTIIFSYESLTKSKIFEHYAEKIMNLGICEKKSINLELKKLMEIEEQDRIKLNTEKIPHFFNLLLEQLLSEELSTSLKESYLRVILRRTFNHGVALVKLYQFCNKLGDNDDNIRVIIDKLLFIISKYPTIIYDLYQLSIFQIIPFAENITDDHLEELHTRFHAKDISELKLLYWFFKIIVVGKEEHLPFEKISYENNYLLIAFLIRVKPSILNEELIKKCENLIKSPEGLFGEQWLIFYEYSIYKKKPLDIPDDSTLEKSKFIKNDKKRLQQTKDFLGIVKTLISDEFSLMNNLEELKDINELSSKNKRWKLSEIEKLHKKWILSTSKINNIEITSDLPNTFVEY